MKTSNCHFLLSSFFVAFALTFMATASSADFTMNKCNNDLKGNEVIQVSRQYREEDGLCILSITPRNIVNLKYRDYYFDNEGFFMVFNSYGPGPDATMTGARSFFTFPQVEDYPDYSFEPNGDVIVKMVSGHQLRISGKDFSLQSLSDGHVTERPVAKDNNGGVEISLTRGFWVDGGFRLGGLKISNPKSRSVFNSGTATQTCTMENRSYLNYPNSEGDFALKYKGEKLTQFVKAKCPQLNL